ncbi:hypothetical protein HAX54_022611 [Datura stramonium]|uniref:RING-type E3 ubiquitin transferase n=1 Tax=Datura stramonium TaxID=4076 RepID=A0ABS8S6S2_DATST|nr:hypothetical protein [Datura stramonium]
MNSNSYYYVPTNMFVPHGPTWFDNNEDSYLRNFYAATTNYYYHQPTNDNFGYHQAPANYHYISRDIDDPYLRDDYNQQSMGPDHMYNGQSLFHHIEDPYLWDDIYNRSTSEFNDDLLQHLVANMEGNEEEEATEEIIENLMKTRPHSGADKEGEICVICQCEYENEETIGTLECEHEYHESCIKQWLLKGRDVVQFVGLQFCRHRIFHQDFLLLFFFCFHD